MLRLQQCFPCPRPRPRSTSSSFSANTLPRVLERQRALTNSHSPSALISWVPSTMEDVRLRQRPRPRPEPASPRVTPAARSPHPPHGLHTSGAGSSHRKQQARQGHPDPGRLLTHSSACPAFSAFPAEHPSKGPTPRLRHPFTRNTFQPGCSPNTERVLKQDTKSTSIQKP